MQSLIPQLAALVGLLLLLDGLWKDTSLERTLVVAGGMGLAAYLVLGVGYAVVRRVLAEVPPPAAEAPSEPAPEPEAEPADPVTP